MPVHHVVLASGAVVAVSVAVATALAMYENPELRRYADDIRRRIAMALHSLGDGINPREDGPVFNRPEDADGFLQSSRGAGAEPGVDADDETRQRQREELMYWNSVLLQEKKPSQTGQTRPGTRGATFDDFLTQDETAQQGTYISSTGADVRDHPGAGLRHRTAGVAASSSVYANPFADENYVDRDELAALSAGYVPGKKEEDHMSDLYSATTRETADDDDDDVQSRTLDRSPALIELPSSQPQPQSQPLLPPTLERQLAADEYMTASQDEDRHEAYASIQAWAHDSSSRDFYSPLLAETPLGQPVSEPEVLSDDGQLTPTDSVSVIGSSEVAELGRNATTHEPVQTPLDVLSENEGGVLTPVSWSEVGSFVSVEDDAHGHGRGFADSRLLHG
ncbi:hypothetical protein E4U41_001921 [Claviceps citrina]|nr:hypothetical protein E4U41_001921 [Claviceps citrina]